jgi:DHA2 family multidrug resistance protein-like MFS transporter
MDPAEDGLPIPQRYWAILTLMVGVALSCLDTALVNVALPRIAKDLNSSPADSIWVVNAYQLAVMISLLPLASFGDIFGYRRVYRFGLVLYTSAALISALAGSLEMLTLGRALQGLGAAGIMSVNTALIRYTYPRRQLGRGIALTSLVVSTSSAAGPTVAAAILSIASWPWLFAVNVPIGIVTLALSMRLLPHTEPSGHRFDLWSAVLCALMFGSLISGINGLGHGQAAPAVAGEFIGAVATGYLLVRRQAAQAMPLLPIDLFRRPIFSVSVTTSVLCFIAQGLAFVSLPFYLQDVIGVSAVATGLLMTPWPATSALMAPFAGRLADRYPASILGSIGLAIVGVGFVLLAVLPSHPGTGDILWRIAVCGGGMGLFQQPNARAIVMAAPRERSGGAGAIQGSARLLGQSIGAAMVALVFGVSVGGHGAVTALVLAACFAAVATVVSLTRQFDFVRARRPEREPGATEPADAPGSAAFVGSRRGRHPLGGS